MNFKRRFHPNTKLHPGDPMYVEEEAAANIANWRLSILLFIKDNWGLEPQPVKPSYQKRWEEVELATGDTWLRLKDEVTAEWFGDCIGNGETGEELWDWYKFEKGKHISWQQTLILMAFEKAIHDKRLSRHISIKSGHGIGKSATVSWIVLWFLYCFFMSQVPVTAPTSGQMHDVLWKELAIWIGRMRMEYVKDVFEWNKDYIRVLYEPESWFARAKTSSKENTEALAGVHADHVLIAVDEASGVPEQVFNTAEGALTSGNVWVILISNPTRTMGYFYDSHNKNAGDWQTFTFNCEQAPLVDTKYVQRQAKRHGTTSDEYRIRVKGMFPSEDMMDDSGYLQLVPVSKVTVIPDVDVDMLVGRKIYSIDPSGEGDDECEFILRDRFRAINIRTLNTTNDKEIAAYVLEDIEKYNLKSGDACIEGFGKGADVAKHVAVATKGKFVMYVIMPGTAPKEEEILNPEFFSRFSNEVNDKEEDLFLNLRALAHFRMRYAMYGGFMLVDNNTENSEWAQQVSVNKYKRTLQGNKIQMMPKKEMNKLRIPSPNKSDALANSFLLDTELVQAQSPVERQAIVSAQQQVSDPFEVL